MGRPSRHQQPQDGKQRSHHKTAVPLEVDDDGVNERVRLPNRFEARRRRRELLRKQASRAYCSSSRSSSSSSSNSSSSRSSSRPPATTASSNTLTASAFGVDSVSALGSTADVVSAYSSVTSLVPPSTSFSNDCAVRTDLSEDTELSLPLDFRLRKQLARVIVARSSDTDESPGRSTTNMSDTIAGTADKTAIAAAAIAAANNLLKVTGELLEESPEDAEVRCWHGRAFLLLGRRKDAAAQWQRAAQDDPAQLHAKVLIQTLQSMEDVAMLGHVAHMDGRLSDAIKFYSQGIEQAPVCPDICTLTTLYFRRALVHHKLGDLVRANGDVMSGLASKSLWMHALEFRNTLLVKTAIEMQQQEDLNVVQ